MSCHCSGWFEMLWTGSRPTAAGSEKDLQHINKKKHLLHIRISICITSFCHINRKSGWPNCSFSLPQRDSRVLMRRRCPASRMLSASLVSSSLVQVGSKLSSQLISSSSMAAGPIWSCSISDAENMKHMELSFSKGFKKSLSRTKAKDTPKKLHLELSTYCKWNKTGLSKWWEKYWSSQKAKINIFNELAIWSLQYLQP